MPPAARPPPWRARAAWWRAAAALLLASAAAREDPPRRALRLEAAAAPEPPRAGPLGLAAAAGPPAGSPAGGPEPSFELGGEAPPAVQKLARGVQRLARSGGPSAPAPAPAATVVDPGCPCNDEDACDCDQGLLYEAVLNVTREEFAALGGSAAFQAQEWRQKLRETAQAQLELGGEAMSRVARQESLATLREAVATKEQELLAARRMSGAVQDARAWAVPVAVDESARVWAGNLSRNVAAQAMEPAVQAAVEEVRGASELRRRAAQHAQAAALLEGNLTGLAEAVQGAQPAMDGLVGVLANYSGAVGAAARRLSHVSDTSEGSAELAYQTALEARDTARASLDRSRAAEQSALEALARSRANAGRIASLKSRMAKVLEDEQANEAAADAATSTQ